MPTDVTWKVRRVTADIGNWRTLSAYSDGSWMLSNAARADVRSGRDHRGGIDNAKQAAVGAAREMGWLSDASRGDAHLMAVTAPGAR